MRRTSSLLSYRYSGDPLFHFFRFKRKERPSSGNIVTASHESCPSCQGTDSWLIAEVDREGFACDTVVCKTCGLVFNDSYIAAPEEFYKERWGDERWGDPEKNFLKRIAPGSYSWARMAYVCSTLGDEFSKIKSVLEIGCGDGCNLYPYHLNGIQVTGYDFDARYLEPGRKRGMDLRESDIDEGTKFDLIQLIHSFEHIIDLDRIVSKVSRLLSPGGYVYVEVPGLLGWNRRRRDAKNEMGFASSNNFLRYLQIEHNYHFDLAHLRWFWERNGFSLVTGDEWIRSVFSFKDRKDKSVFERTLLNGTSGTNVLRYLESVERDFLSVGNLACKAVGLMTRKRC